MLSSQGAVPELAADAMVRGTVISRRHPFGRDGTDESSVAVAGVFNVQGKLCGLLLHGIGSPVTPNQPSRRARSRPAQSRQRRV